MEDALNPWAPGSTQEAWRKLLTQIKAALVTEVLWSKSPEVKTSVSLFPCDPVFQIKIDSSLPVHKHHAKKHLEIKPPQVHSEIVLLVYS